jgi:hypothetical protein
MLVIKYALCCAQLHSISCIQMDHNMQQLLGLIGLAIVIETAALNAHVYMKYD